MFLQNELNNVGTLISILCKTETYGIVIQRLCSGLLLYHWITGHLGERYLNIFHLDFSFFLKNSDNKSPYRSAVRPK